MYPIPLKFRFDRTGWLLLFLSGYSIAAITALKSYIQPFSVNCILGTVALFATFSIQRGSNRSFRFALLAIFFALFYVFIPAKTILFASIAMSLFFLVETFFGRIHYLAIACIVLMSPIAEYATNLFSFPIRLFLTSLAGNILKVIRPETEVEGNIIVTKTSQFSVDPACMGLHMLIASLLAGVILISIIQKKQDRTLTLSGFFICMVVVFLLNIISNLFRILCLVHFNIGPDSVMHNITGIVCFVVYIVVPTVFVIRFTLTYFGKNRIMSQTNGHAQVRSSRILQNAFLLALTISVIIPGRGRSVNEHITVQLQPVPGYAVSQLADHITKLENGDALVYIKPIAGFYSSDHQPMICWSGSGYEFNKVRETEVAGCRVYDAVLQKQKDVLYTAWWYDNGSTSTISQVEWRWNSLRNGERYALVNVTAATPEELNREIGKLLRLRPFNKILAVK